MNVAINGDIQLEFYKMKEDLWPGECRGREAQRVSGNNMFSFFLLCYTQSKDIGRHTNFVGLIQVDTPEFPEITCFSKKKICIHNILDL